MARSISGQLLRLFDRSDVTSYEELARLTKEELDLTGDSVSRKLRGKQVMTTVEAETFARTLRAHIRVHPRRAA